MVDQSKGVGLNVSYLAKNSTDARSPRSFPIVDFFALRKLVLFLGFQRCTRLRWPSVSLRREHVVSPVVPFEARVRADFKAGARSGVNGTPTFFINGHRHDGSFDFETLVSAIHQAMGTAKSA